MCDNSCPFLERSKSGLLCCAAGVNFYAVGRAREICQLCPLFDGGWTPTCEFMEVYTFLHAEKEQRRIEVRVDCRPLENEVAGCVREDEVARGDIDYGRIDDLRRHPGL